MPLFVVVVRYGALSRYRCVPAEDERGSLRGTKRYADKFAAVATLRGTFGPDDRKCDDKLDRPVFGRSADRADLYGVPTHAFLETVNRLVASTFGYDPVKWNEELRMGTR